MYSTRIYVNVSFNEKEQAKSKGAKWEPVYKKWFFTTKRAIDEKATEYMGYEIYKFPKQKIETVEVKKDDEIKPIENLKIYKDSYVCRFCASDKLTKQNIKSIKLEGYIFSSKPCWGCEYAFDKAPIRNPCNVSI